MHVLTVIRGRTVGMLAVLILVGIVAAKIWKRFEMKHLLKVSFDPARILVTYSQVTSQRGTGLELFRCAPRTEIPAICF